MALVYSRRLGQGSLSSAGSTAIYTVPAGVTAVVRSCSFTTLGGSANAANLIVGGAYEIAGIESGTLYVPVVVNLRAVLNAGEVLTFEITGGSFHVMVSGYELDS